MITVFSKRTKRIIYQVRHYFIFGWKDKRVLSISNQDVLFKLLIKMNNNLKKYPASPLLIHCNTGIGRTGVLMCIYEIYNDFLRAKENNTTFKFSIFDTVLRLRYMRKSIIETKEQYAFIYRFVNKYLK